MSRKTAVLTLSVLTICIILAGPASADIATGLVGYWPLDGDAVDASGNGHDGTINGNVTVVADRHDTDVDGNAAPVLVAQKHSFRCTLAIGDGSDQGAARLA